MQALIAAGGVGPRPDELTRNSSSPMLDVDGRPLLETIVLNLKYFGITDILIALGPLGHKVEEHFGDGAPWGVSLRHLHAERPTGSGGALALALDLLAGRLLLLNGATIFDVNYLDLAGLLEQRGATGALALRQVEHASRAGAVRVATDGRVLALGPEAAQGAGYVNGGVYVFRNEVTRRVTRLPYSIENDLLPALVAEQALVARPYGGFFVDLDRPADPGTAQEAVRAWWRKPLAILDRDGVVNKDNDFVAQPDEFEWVAGAPAAIKLLNDSGYRVVVATNQSGIARGYYSEQQFHAFMAWIAGRLALQGGHFDAVYYCPHLPDGGTPEYRRHCSCRKPAPGMVLQALREFQAPPERSFLIGDKTRDCEAAQRAGIRGYLFDEADNLLEFVQGILSQQRAPSPDSLSADRL